MKIRLISFIFSFAFVSLQLRSDPLENWHWRNPLPTGTVTAVGYGNGIFVAASGTAVLTSTNGTIWTAVESNLRHRLANFVYGNDLFVAMGIKDSPEFSASIMTSPDGVNWTPRLTRTNASLSQIKYGNGLFVTFGVGEALTSTNGIDWVRHELPSECFAGQLEFGNGVFASVCYRQTGPYTSESVILTSTDGLIWTERFTFSGAASCGIAYGSGLFVVMTFARNAITSSDGLVWTKRPAASGHELRSIAYGNGKFVVFTTTADKVISTNGIDWTTQSSGFSGSWVNYQNGFFFGLGLGLWTSSNGVDWTNQIHGFSDTLTRVSYEQGNFIALGHNETILTSSDGVAWQKRHGDPTGGVLVDIAYSNERFVATSSDGKVLISTNLDSWSSIAVDTNVGLKAIAFGNNTFVVSGDPPSLFVSSDGLNWTRNTNWFKDDFGTVDHFGGVFVAYAWSGKVLTSPDGYSWTLRAILPAFHNAASFASNGRLNLILIWSTFLPDAPAIIASSTNMIDWDVEARPDMMLSEYAIAYGGGMFVITGWGNYIAVSVDGKNWEKRYVGLYGRSIAYGNGTFVAVSGTSILQSDPVIQLGLRDQGTVSLSGMLDRSYRIEVASDLGLGSNWQALTTFTLTNSPYLWRDDSPTLPDRRFYRAVLVP